MKTASSILIVFAMVAFVATSTYAQSRVQVDPGVSVHNYKHPNKAQKAKQQTGYGTSIVVPSIGLVERVTNARDRRQVRHTPKYANRPAALAIPSNGVKEQVRINPLTSPNNYKTNPVSKPSVPESSVAALPPAESTTTQPRN